MPELNFRNVGCLNGIFVAIATGIFISWLTGDVDECKDGTHNCDPNASCHNTKEGYICVCNPGYTGNGAICTSVEEGGYSGMANATVFTLAVLILAALFFWNRGKWREENPRGSVEAAGGETISQVQTEPTDHVISADTRGAVDLSQNKVTEDMVEGPADDLRRRREEIANYKPGSWTSKYVEKEFKSPEHIAIGVFGVQGSGKSALLNSFLFAVKGKWKQEHAEGSEHASSESVYQMPSKLNDHVNLVDTRGLVDLSPNKVSDVMEEIRGNRRMDTKEKCEEGEGSTIDCPIFVFKYSPVTGTELCKEFLKGFMTEVKKWFASNLIVVITHADCIADKRQVTHYFDCRGIAESDLYFIENYTAKEHNEDEQKHIQLLEILLACLKRADDNIIFRWRRNHEPEPKRYPESHFSCW